MKRLLTCIGWLTLLAMFLSGFYYLSRFEKDVSENAYEVKKSELIDQNPDVYAWLTVEGTRIDYPVAQHPADDSYYLFHDLEGVETYYGAIFTELVNTKSFDDPVTIIYGHAMRDESMFGSLTYFTNQQFFKEHTVIRIDTVDHRYEYDIIAAHAYGDDHLYHVFQLNSHEGVSHYLSGLKDRTRANGGYYRDVDVISDRDRLLILSTCDATDDTHRYLVTAKLRTVTERTDT